MSVTILECLAFGARHYISFTSIDETRLKAYEAVVGQGGREHGRKEQREKVQVSIVSSRSCVLRKVIFSLLPTTHLGQSFPIPPICYSACHTRPCVYYRPAPRRSGAPGIQSHLDLSTTSPSFWPAIQIVTPPSHAYSARQVDVPPSLPTFSREMTVVHQVSRTHSPF